MKKTILVLALVGILMFPFGTQAATVPQNSEVLSRILALQVQILQLQIQLNELLFSQEKNASTTLPLPGHKLPIVAPVKSTQLENGCYPILDKFGHQEGVVC